jgi:hypothetical protein
MKGRRLTIDGDGVKTDETKPQQAEPDEAWVMIMTRAIGRFPL